MSTLDFEEIVQEMEKSCPFTYKALSVMIDEQYNREKKIAPLSLIYSIIMFRRCHELSRLQRINTMLLAESDANTEVIHYTIVIYTIYLNATCFSYSINWRKNCLYTHQLILTITCCVIITTNKSVIPHNS